MGLDIKEMGDSDTNITLLENAFQNDQNLHERKNTLRNIFNNLDSTLKPIDNRLVDFHFDYQYIVGSAFQATIQILYN